jgi:glutamyl-tRNA synthetase
LSKRDGDRLGFPVAPLNWRDPNSGETTSGYREKGYYPEAVLNFLALLGWNPGTTQEIFSLDQLVEAFSLDRVSKSGAKFDFEKAKWFNHQYLLMRSDEELAEQFMPLLQQAGYNKPMEYVKIVTGLVKERANFVGDFLEHSRFFFEAPKVYDEATLKKKWKPETQAIMQGWRDTLSNTDDYTTANLEAVSKAYLESINVGIGQVLQAFRIMITGIGAGPSMFEVCSLIGKEEVVSRFDSALSFTSNL